MRSLIFYTRLWKYYKPRITPILKNPDPTHIKNPDPIHIENPDPANPLDPAPAHWVKPLWIRGPQWLVFNPAKLMKASFTVIWSDYPIVGQSKLHKKMF